MRNKINFFTAGALFIIALSAIAAVDTFKKPKSNIAKSKKIEVVTSFYPLYYFLSEIGKENVSVINLTPVGAEPHDFEPNTQDISKINKSSLLILNGAGLEPYGDKLKRDLKGSRVRVVTVVEELANQEVKKNEKKIIDPHVWLDPVLAKKEVIIITQALIEADLSHRSVYEVNSQNLISKLDSLDFAFKEGLKSCQQKDIVTSHAAFGYLATRYGFNQISLTGLSPGHEPSPQDFVNIVKLVKKNNIKYIFFETLVSSRLAETLAQETGAKTLIFNPLEDLTKEEQAAGKDYFSVQMENLKNLKIALGCLPQ